MKDGDGAQPLHEIHPASQPMPQRQVVAGHDVGRNDPFGCKGASQSHSNDGGSS